MSPYVYLMSLIKYYKSFCKNAPKHCNFKSLYLKFYRSNFKNFNCFGIVKEWRIFKVIIYSILTILKNLPEVPNHKTPIKRLQDSYKSPINSYKSLIKRLHQEIAKHNKMLEYLNFFLLCPIFTSIFYLYIRIKKYFPILKMAEELIGNLGYGAPQSDTKRQKLLEFVLTRNRKLYLGKVYTEEQLAKFNEEEVEKLFNNYEAKLRAKW